jgi:hypothetical protein
MNGRETIDKHKKCDTIGNVSTKNGFDEEEMRTAASSEAGRM